MSALKTDIGPFDSAGDFAQDMYLMSVLTVFCLFVFLTSDL